MNSPPLAIRALNRLGAFLQAIGLDPLKLEPDTLQSIARKVARLDDFGDDDFREGLDVLCKSARQDAKLSFFGRLAFRRQVIQTLVTRLQLTEQVRTQPELFNTPLVPPIIVMGLPRSGTTYLHRLLDLDPASRSLKLWEVLRPIHGAGPDKRRAEIVKDLKWLKRMAPDIDAKHFLGADVAEECLFLLNTSFKSLAFWVGQPVYSYLDWLGDQDCHHAYQLYRKHLQIFQAQSPEQRLVLKSPVHTGYLGELSAAVPEAKIVFTHRDPVAVNASVNSLFRSLFGIVSDDLHVEKMARTNLDMLTTAAERALQSRKDFPPQALIDIQYTDLLSHPIDCVRRIYSHFDLAFEEDFHQRLTTYVADRPQHHFGVHSYSLDEFGITESEVQDRFAEYVQMAAPEAASSGR